VTEPVPIPATDERRITEHHSTELTVRGRRLRVAVRRAAGGGPARTPLLLMNGLGAQLEVLEPLVDQLPPDLEVIRFDVPGVGGSPAPLLPTTSPRSRHWPGRWCGVSGTSASTCWDTPGAAGWRSSSR
jgi:pimeloyl-ACP methyl ester carboxylesterase